MADKRLNRRFWQAVLRLLLCCALLLSLLLLSQATQNSATFGRLHMWLLFINSATLIVLVGLILVNLWRLALQYRAGAAGSRLTARLVIMVILLSVAPGAVVYYFSTQFLRSGIDSWFDVRVEHALDDALALSQAALDQRSRDLLKRLQAVTSELEGVPDALMPYVLNEVRDGLGASEMSIVAEGGRVVASSSQDPGRIMPDPPEETVLLQLRRGLPYTSLDLGEDGGLHVRILIPIGGAGMIERERVLQALFPVPARLSRLADQVQRGYGEYRELAYLREPLKQSFMLTLSLVLLLTLLFAVWTAFYMARRIVAPVRDLVEGTRAVAAGDYGTQLPAAGHDELGFLVQSFNDMSRRVAQTREAAKRSQAQVENQRAHLETVLSRLSSGVLVLDVEGRLRTWNQAAEGILAVPLGDAVGHSLQALLDEHEHLTPLADAVMPRLREGAHDWRAEVDLEGTDGHRVLICSGAQLPGGYGTGGHVLVVEDVTTLVQAQRDAAWGEVARRLAHEIKNPLTPIQLSAERIRHKYLDRMEGRDADVLERATRTIVQQVDAMKEMVNAFSEYARPPKLVLGALDLNALLREIVELYRSNVGSARIQLRLAPDLPQVRADGNRLRQLMHNLIKNALEAVPVDPVIDISTQVRKEPDGLVVELQVSDNGPGFPAEVLSQIYEPYVTTKAKGTGLGLAIVKKIVEEHSGSIRARNSEQGAQVLVRLPVAADRGTALAKEVPL